MHCIHIHTASKRGLYEFGLPRLTNNRAFVLESANLKITTELSSELMLKLNATVFGISIVVTFRSINWTFCNYDCIKYANSAGEKISEAEKLTEIELNLAKLGGFQATQAGVLFSRNGVASLECPLNWPDSAQFLELLWLQLFGLMAQPPIYIE